jgi:2-polyprenyl-6-methoxyphenol hydroxylase-like FAD-dependent oxidoreductase
MRVVISGAGVSGLMLAAWLAEYGVTATVVEKAPELVVGGYKIDVRGAAVDVVARTGILEQIEEASTHMRAAILVDRDGNELARMTGDDFGHRIGDDLEIVRGSLCHILARRSAADIVFGATVAGITETDSGIDVALSTGETIRADVLVGADGLHSSTRALAFGPEDEFRRDLGMSLCVFSVPNDLGLDREELQYSEIGRVAAIWATRDEPMAKATFGYAATDTYDRRDRTAQQQSVRDAVTGVGWEVPRLLDRMADAPDWYFDSAAQIEMPSWTSGRVALVGDAAYCASPMSGQGSSLALVGAYVLAGELGTAPDIPTAFAAYDAKLRPFIEANQELGRISAARMADPEPGASTELTAEQIEGVLDSTTDRIADAARAIELEDYQAGKQ